VGQDPLVIAAVGGSAASLFTALGLVVVAVINSRTERRKAAENSADEVMEKRLLLKDEQNQHLREQNVHLQTALDDCISENKRLRSKR
jgi:hypothetical protein